MNTKASFIIPYRKNNDDREKNMEIVLQWIAYNFPLSEIIIVEMDKDEKFNKTLISDNLEYIFEYDSDVFNRSLARNIGAIKAKNKVLVFIDCDIIMDAEVLQHAINICEYEYEVVNPCIELVDFIREDFDIVKNGIYQFKSLFSNIITNRISNNGSFREDMNIAAAIILINKKSFYKIGGWPTEFIGWGGEDNVMAHKIKQLCKYTTIKEFAYHLYHERNIYDCSKHPEYESNCLKMDKILKFDIVRLREYCSEQRLKMDNIKILS